MYWPTYTVRVTAVTAGADLQIDYIELLTKTATGADSWGAIKAQYRE